MEYNRLYDYSRKYLSFKQKSKGLFIKLGLNALFGILLYFSVYFLIDYPDKIFISIFIAGAIITSLLVELAWENSEIKKIKTQEKIYAQNFIKLHSEYEEALKNIKSRDEFLSIVSHELKTPLTVMLLKLHSELNNIKSSSLANFSVHELVGVLQNSEKQIKWLQSMVNDLLDVSLITTGRMILELENTDLVSITKQVKQSFSEVIKKEKCKVKINAGPSVIGKWDKVRIEQLVTNLFSNAIKYGEGKPIDINISQSGNNGKFIIKDKGIGITSEEQKVIFDLFKRAPGQGGYKKGLGVGLFICYQIVKIHGGRINVSSSPAKGTSFTVELPLNKK